MVGRAELRTRLDILAKNKKLSEGLRHRLGSATNSMDDHLKADDLIGALRDRLGVPVRKQGRHKDGDQFFDHEGEVADGLKSLRNAHGSLLKEMKKLDKNSDEYAELSKQADAIKEYTARVEKFQEMK